MIKHDLLLKAFELPIAVETNPDAIELPIAVELMPLAFELYPDAKENFPTLSLSQLLGHVGQNVGMPNIVPLSTAPTLKAALSGYHIIRTPAPCTGGLALVFSAVVSLANNTALSATCSLATGAVVPMPTFCAVANKEQKQHVANK